MSGEDWGGSRIERILGMAVLAALAVALAASEIARFSAGNAARRDVAALAETVEVARSEAQAALSAVISPEAVAAANASVYLVVVDGMARATAFVVDRDNGILATAGHTASSLPFDEPGVDIHILNRATRAPIRVTGGRVHAGFGEFRKLVEEYQPVRKNSSIYTPRAAPVRDLAFDAAYIFVDPIDPVTGVNRLGPNLPIAPEEKLLRLAAGAPIAVIGYPYDRLDQGFAPEAATSRIERGVIAAIIPPLDNAAEDEDPVVANLIVHRLSTAGGSSGSPVINAEGEVIGIHTHGIESISSNADGAAQRADVLYDLASPEREAQRLVDIFYPAWSRTLSYWARAGDVLPWSFYKEYHDPGAEPEPRVGEIDFVSPPPFSKTLRTLNFSEAVDEWRAEASDTGAADASAFLIKNPGEYAETSFELDRSREAVIFAYDYSLRARTGACPLTGYWRVSGETRLRVVAARTSFELHLPAEAPRAETVHVVLRRPPGCDPLSQSFVAGAIDWPPGDEAAQLSLAAGRGAPDFTEAPFGVRFAHTAKQSISNFFGCTLKETGKRPESCAPAQYIELESGAE